MAHDHSTSSAVQDPARLAALRRLGLASTAAFDRLTRLAAAHLGVPVTLVALVEEDRQLIAGSTGLPEPFESTRQIPGDYSYCRHVVETREALAVEDAREHPLFRNHPALLEFGAVSYVGIPLFTAEGHVLGSFCAVDGQPREWTPEQVAFLADLSASAMTEIELRQELRERAQLEQRVAEAAEERAEAEARSTRILESITDAFFAVDPEWRFTYVNQAATRLLRRSAAELLGSEIWDAFPEAVGTTFEREYRRAVDQNVTAVFEEYYAPLEMWVSVHAFPSAEGLSVYFTDISARKQAEARQAATEAHYRRLATNLPLAVYAVDVEGRFTEVNPATTRVLARSADELMGAPFALVIAPEDLPSVQEVFTRVISGQADDVPFEACIRRPSGEERLLAITATAIREGGTITGLHGIARDVSEERKAERALQESEERLRLIAENVREIFWIFTPDFSKALYLSPRYEDVAGHSLAAVYRDARAFLDPVHPDDLPALKAAMERIRHEAVEEGVEFRYSHSDGTERWFLAHGYPIRDENGVVHRVVGTSEDITERKRAETALRGSERRLRQILDALPVGVYLVDKTRQLVWHNPAGLRIWGDVRPMRLDQEFGAYKGWWPETGERLRPGDWPLIRVLDGAPVSGGEITDIEAFDGTRRTILNWAVPLHDETGEITGAVGVQEDITEARAQQARQRLLTAALDGLQEGVCLLTPEGEYLYSNETYRRILGIEPSAPMPIRLQDTTSDEDARRMYEDCLRAATEQGRWSGRIRKRRLDSGQPFYIDVVLGRVDSGFGGASLLFGIVQDASEEIRREQQLRRAERLASVGTLLSGVAHELNNPLQAIQSFMELMLMRERDPESRDSLGTVYREARRMGKIVANLKQIARSSQEEERERAAVDLNEVVRHVLRVQEYRLRTGNVEVREDLAVDLPKVFADQGEIEQVVLNLVVNAKQAMVSHRGEGRLIVRTRASARGVALHVVDNGPGIPADQLERIWDPFYTTKSPGEGTGLGLSLVHSIVTEHGGEIRVDSEVDTGTAFRVDLPRALEAPPQAPQAPPERAPAESLRVLIVDDEPSVRKVMALYLQQRGHSVDQAAEGMAALQMLEAAEYDVILSDLRMPGLGGEAMMERLRAQRRAQRVIFMTGDVSGAGARLGHAGVTVLLKPLQLEEVARAVEGADTRDSSGM